MRFGRGLVFVFDESWAFIRRAWWLAIVPTFPWLAYELFADLLPSTYLDPAYWSAAVLSAIVYTAATYWVMRFIALEHDLAAALTIDRNSARTFAPYFAVVTAVGIVLEAWAYFYSSDWVLIAQGVIWLILVSLVAPWTVTAPSGSTVIGPLRSAVLVTPSLPWAIALLIILLIPISLVSWAALEAVFALAELSVRGTSLNEKISAVAQALIEAYSNVVLLVALFVIAHRAGVRVNPTRQLAAVFD